MNARPRIKMRLLFWLFFIFISLVLVSFSWRASVANPYKLAGRATHDFLSKAERSPQGQDLEDLTALLHELVGLGDLRSILMILDRLDPKLLSPHATAKIVDILKPLSWSGQPPAQIQKFLTHLQPAAPLRSVLIRFRQHRLPMSQLFAAGNWNAAGEPDAPAPWAPLAMKKRGGVWEAMVALRPCRPREVYHVSVTSSPDGGSLGHATFVVTPAPGHQVVDIPWAPEPSSVYRPANSAASKNIKVLLVGVDMGSWRAFAPLMARGRLPHLKHMVQHGSSGRLYSLPGGYDSLPLLTSGLTGVLPGRHNVLGKEKLYAVNMSRRSWPLWMLASREGLQVGAVGWPGSWPPDKVNGFVVTDAFFAGQMVKTAMSQPILQSTTIRRFAESFGFDLGRLQSAITLAGRLAKRFETTWPSALGLHAIGPENRPPPTTLESIVSDFFDEEVVRLADVLSQSKPLDLMTFYIYQLDYISHAFWKHFEPALYSPAVLDAPVAYGFDKWLEEHRIQGAEHETVLVHAYERFDRYLGVLLDRAENVVLFSDHGSVPGDPGAEIFGIELTRLLALYLFRDGKALPMESLDWHQNNEHKKLTFVLPVQEAAPMAEAFADFLRRLHFSGERQPVSPLFPEVSVTRRAPVTVEFRINHRVKPQDRLMDGNWQVSMDRLSGFNPVVAQHSMDGIIVLYGPAFKRGFQMPDAHLCDVAPTVMYLLGLPVAGDLDGRTLLAAFDPGFVSRRPMRTTNSYGRDRSGWWRFIRAFRWRNAHDRDGSIKPSAL